MPILSCDTVLRKRLVEFLNNYMARITNITNQEGVFSFTSLENCDEIKSTIEKLKSYCDDVESASSYASALNTSNQERQRIEAKVFEQANRLVEISKMNIYEQIYMIHVTVNNMIFNP